MKIVKLYWKNGEKTGFRKEWHLVLKDEGDIHCFYCKRNIKNNDVCVYHESLEYLQCMECTERHNNFIFMHGASLIREYGDALISKPVVVEIDQELERVVQDKDLEKIEKVNKWQTS